jgi:capsular polysaccharide biosynthesis protein
MLRIPPPPSWHATELLSGAITPSTYDADTVSLAREAFKPIWGEASTPRLKLFVRRRGGQRHLTNADEAEKLAIAAHYRVIDPGLMGLKEQIDAFNAASHIIRPRDAWAANLLFARDDVKVTILVDLRGRKEHLEDAGEVCGIDVEERYCPVTHFREHYPIHSDVRVPIEELAPRLRAELPGPIGRFPRPEVRPFGNIAKPADHGQTSAWIGFPSPAWLRPSSPLPSSPPCI